MRVIPDPLDCHPLIEQPLVAHDIVRAQVQEPEGRHAVLERRHDNVLLRGEDARVVHVQGGRAAVEGAAIDPELEKKREIQIEIKGLVGDINGPT